MLALVPASKPATAAPVSKKRFDFVIFPNDLLVNFTALRFRRPAAQRPLNHWAQWSGRNHYRASGLARTWA
jgi:hypothetical protein